MKEEMKFNKLHLLTDRRWRTQRELSKRTQRDVDVAGTNKKSWGEGLQISCDF